MRTIAIYMLLLFFCFSSYAQKQFTNSGNFTVHGGARVSFYGDLVNNGSFIDSGFIISFNGSVAQSIGGTATINFNNLRLNKTNGSIALNAPENVWGILTLTSGVLTTTSTNVLTLNEGAAATSGNITSYVNGPMAKKGNTAFVFPLGNEAFWARLGVSAPATIGNKLTAQYFRSSYSNTTSVSAPLANVSAVEYWTLSESIPGDSVNVTLFWQSSITSGIYAYDSTLRVAHFNGTLWDDEGQTSVTPGIEGSITSGKVSSFSPFTFGSTNATLNPLPISVLLFQVQLNKQGTVDITWSTATELNNKEFIVERSVDRINFTSIISLPGAGNSNQILYYKAVDEKPYLGTGYYRLKQVDFEGNYKISSIEAVTLEPESALVIFPNPVQSLLFLKYNSDVDATMELEILDISGQIIQHHSISFARGCDMYSLDIHELAKGIYFLQYENGGKLTYLKFVKQ